MMRKILTILLAALLVLPSAAFALPAGTYTGTAQGFGGEVEVTVTLTEEAIESITAEGYGETPNLGSIAIEQLPETMVQEQVIEVDSISGATVTSKAVIEAATAALAAANVKPEDITPAQKTESNGEIENLTADVIVIGAGGAGLSAALVAAEEGKSVIVLEKMPYAGGNTTKATGGMNAAETAVQKELGIEDTVQTFIDDTIKGGKEVNDLALITTMAENSADAIDWLTSIGAPLPEVSFSGGATNKRIHRPEGGAAVGPYLIEHFVKNADANENITILYDTKAIALVKEDGQVVGVSAEKSGNEIIINGKAVVLATGGFGANLDMVAQYKPELKGFVTTNSPSATGDGLVMAEEAGAQLVDMDQIQIHPTVHQETSIMITESVRGGGAIMVNQKGERFTDEMGTRDVVSAAEIAQEGGYSYLIFDQAQRENLSAIESYVKNGLTLEAETLEELAALINVDKDTFLKTVEDWNKAVAGETEDALGRTTAMDVNVSKAPYYAIQISPGIHHTMGGVKIDTTTQVLDKENNPIKGLYAAGEVTGGIHGANRIGGNAVADIVVFGRIAGQNAADFAGK